MNDAQRVHEIEAVNHPQDLQGEWVSERFSSTYLFTTHVRRTMFRRMTL
jgi:hypothetical protein